MKEQTGEDGVCRILPRPHAHVNLTNNVGSQPFHKKKRSRKLSIFGIEIRVLEIKMAAKNVSSEQSCTVTDMKKENVTFWALKQGA